ncbi:MAG: nucleotidyltransferase family protein [Christensenellaceae bacterium]|jgi:predicted nucleotidyltransferase|nr:nucleotidyltransferase family protein [Christensenellaceae bacterium]
MKITAIICEYNPMTNGHIRHLNKAKSDTGCDTILCIMSGSFVQRGDPAIADKYFRAQVAVKQGADVVVELPTIYAISPADNFAFGAIKTISAFSDVEYLSFGSECGDAELLTKAAMLLSDEPGELSALIQKNSKNGDNYPKARALALNEYGKKHKDFENLIGILDKPNNVLGIAYITAVLKAGLNIKIHTIKRDGADYNSVECDSDYPSSTAIRNAIKRKDLESIANDVPYEVYSYISKLQTGEDALSDMILFKIKSMSKEELSTCYDVSTNGILNRIKAASISATTLDQLLETAKTKNHTMARIKRLCLYALFGITNKMYQDAVTCPAHVSILAINESRKDTILSSLSLSCKNVLTRFSDVNRVDKTLRFLIQLDFTAQGTLNIINRTSSYNKKMLLVSRS